MRNATLSLMVVAVLVIVFACSISPVPSAFAQGVGSHSQGDGNLISITMPAENGSQHLVLIDRQTRVMSVYAVDPANGKISLLSVRDIKWDLLIEDLNGGSPSPRDVQLMIGQR
ncbi:MAG: hypothetical protein COA78_17965 [Blastopirellula sp.]|nr:MAG: hypothetical protein COA78_17965 [Blastopirellula sp.]